MLLNVYLISHPLIHRLSNQIIYSTETNNNTYTYINSKINFFLIYEALRTWIKIQTIYVKEIDLIKDINIYDSNESYIIMTNITDYCSIISDIKILLPRVHLQHIHLNLKTQKDINDDCLEHNIITTIKKHKIIVMEKFLYNHSIIQLLDYLLLEKKINIQQIKIICTICTNSILETIGNKYPYLTIYTTKILS